MIRKVFLIWAFFLFILVSTTSVEALRINEIMYDVSGSDTNREWIEVYNDLSETVDLSSWKFYEAETNHGLTLVSGSFTLNQGGYAVVVEDSSGFLSDNPGFSGNLIDSSFSLSNTNETIAMKNSSLDIVNTVTYLSSSGANGNNRSLQYVGNSWCEGSPTPGASGSCSSSGSGSNNTNQGNSSNQSTSNSTGNSSQSTSSCTISQTINITSYPEDMEFGEEGEVNLNLNASCYPYKDVRFLVYGSPKKVVSYENGTKITNFASCQGGVTYRGLENKTHSFKIKFFTYPNCDNYYTDGKYSVSIRSCYPEWNKYAESDWVIDISGKNDTFCGEDTTSSDEEVEEAVEEEWENISSDDTVAEITGKSVKRESRGTEKESIYDKETSKGEVIYLSESYDVKNISVSLMGLLFLLLLVYILVNKGKV